MTSFALSPLITAAALVFPAPTSLLSQFPPSLYRYTRNVVIGEADEGATGASLSGFLHRTFSISFAHRSFVSFF